MAINILVWGGGIIAVAIIIITGCACGDTICPAPLLPVWAP